MTLMTTYEDDLLADLPPGSTITTTRGVDGVEVDLIAPTGGGSWVQQRARFDQYTAEYLTEAISHMIDSMRTQIDKITADVLAMTQGLNSITESLTEKWGTPAREDSTGIDPDAPTIDADDAVDLLEKTAEKYGLGTTDSTHMFYGREGCIIGRLMCDLLGVSTWRPDTYRGLFSGSSAPAIEHGVQITKEAERVFRNAMHQNDQGLTWGTIAAAARTERDAANLLPVAALAE